MQSARFAQCYAAPSGRIRVEHLSSLPNVIDQRALLLLARAIGVARAQPRSRYDMSAKYGLHWPSRVADRRMTVEDGELAPQTGTPSLSTARSAGGCLLRGPQRVNDYRDFASPSRSPLRRSAMSAKESPWLRRRVMDGILQGIKPRSSFRSSQHPLILMRLSCIAH